MARLRKKRAQAKEHASDPDDLSCASSLAEYSTDQEYMKIIAGAESDDSDDEDEDPQMKLFLSRFQLADTDGSGNISLGEFLKLSQQQQVEQETQLIKTKSEDLGNRISVLEKSVKENSKKLDMAVASLERIQKLLEQK